MFRNAVLIIAAALCSVSVFALDIDNTQLPELNRQRVRKQVIVPDIMGMKTLKCDFHMHTVFSDGVVWPDVRVQEAWMDGLDAISITDHIEKHPSKEFIVADDDASYKLALPAAVQHDILLVKGSEITRDAEHGHYNALFIKNSSALEKENFFDAMEEAINQGAFIQYNHPGWKAQQPDETRWLPVAEKVFANGWMHGIEVFNGSEWYPKVLGWCIEKNLAVMANTDIHGLVMQQYDTLAGQRPMTLVFAEKRSLDAIKDALFAGRTAGWFGGHVAGRREILEALFLASVTVSPQHAMDRDGNRIFHVANNSDIVLQVASPSAGWGTTKIPARSAVMLKAPKGAESVEVNVANFHTNLSETLTVELKIPEKK